MGEGGQPPTFRQSLTPSDFPQYLKFQEWWNRGDISPQQESFNSKGIGEGYKISKKYIGILLDHILCVY